MSVKTIEISRLARVICDRLPDTSEDERSISLEIYRQLSSGEPITPESLAEPMEMDETTVKQLLAGAALKGNTYYDEGKIVGFLGLATLPMKHRMTIDDVQLYTWCAWDGLFIPFVLGKTAQLELPCLQTGTTVSLTVSEEGISRVDPDGAVMSFLEPESELLSDHPETVISSFCHHIHFLASREAGEQWTSGNPGTFILELDDAFELGRLTMRAHFGLE